MAKANSWWHSGKKSNKLTLNKHFEYQHTVPFRLDILQILTYMNNAAFVAQEEQAHGSQTLGSGKNPSSHNSLILHVE